jgi:predicted HicB family RNase H-like nuclease
MLNYSYHAAWSDEDSGYVATSSEFPGLSGLGDTAEDAIGQLRVAIELALEAYRAAGEAAPPARKVAEYSGQFRLRVPKSVHEELARSAEVEGVSLNTLAVAYLSEGLGRKRAPLRAVPGRSKRRRG